MNKTIASFTVGLLSLWLVGCATHGRVYDDSKVAMIQKGATTEAELVQWFGPPNSRSLSSDGSKSLTWKFAPTKSGSSRSSGDMQVRLDQDGKVTAYSAAAGRK